MGYFFDFILIINRIISLKKKKVNLSYNKRSFFTIDKSNEAILY